MPSFEDSNNPGYDDLILNKGQEQKIQTTSNKKSGNMPSFEDSNKPGHDDLVLNKGQEYNKNESFSNSLSRKEQALIKFGMISLANQHFLYIKKDFNEKFYISKRDFLEAKRERFFAYDDFYENQFLMRESDFLKSSNYKLVSSFEKHLKKLKYEFYEEFQLIPEFEHIHNMILNLNKKPDTKKTNKP